jgi:ribosomal protein L37AE/L43A
MAILDSPACPNCGMPLKIKRYKGIPIYACDNEECKMAFTIEEINYGSAKRSEHKGHHY